MCALSGEQSTANAPTSGKSRSASGSTAAEATTIRIASGRLDPIDGTKGFLRGEQYAVALALIVGGEVAVAALACPNLHFRASRRNGEGGNECTRVAWRDLHCRERRRSVCTAGRLPDGIEAFGQRLEVSATDDPAAVRFCESVESGHSAHGDAAELAARLGITAAPLRMDSQAKYAVVARGEAEIYLRLPTRADYHEKIWDHAAGALIVAEAGGAVTDILGRPLEFQHGRELIANRGVIVSNGRLHARVIAGDRRDRHRPGLMRRLQNREGRNLCHCRPEERKTADDRAYRQTRSIFLRGLGLTYMAAFASMAVQVDGLIGSHGILPAADYLDRARRVLGPGPAPTGGFRPCSGSTRPIGPCTRFAGAASRWVPRSSPAFLPGVCTALALAFLPLDRRWRARIFLGYQWDSLLLEAGLLAVLMAPWASRLERDRDRALVVHCLAGAMAGVSIDVPVGRGQADQSRSRPGGT